MIYYNFMFFFLKCKLFLRSSYIDRLYFLDFLYLGGNVIYFCVLIDVLIEG